MEQLLFNLRNYAHIGDAVWDLYVREYVVFKSPNAKSMHKMTTDRVNATFQKNLLEEISGDLTEEEKDLAKRARNIPIPVGRRTIQHDYRLATAFEVLIGYWYFHDKPRLEYFFNKFKNMESFS